MDRRSAEVERSVAVDGRANLDLPLGDGCVSGDEPDRIAADLDGHVHVLEQLTVRPERRAREIVAADRHAHDVEVRT